MEFGYSNVVFLLKNIPYNIFSFLKSFLRERLYWRAGALQIEDCEKEGNVRIVEPYKIRDVKIGFATYISENSRVSHAIIGKFCSIGPNLFCGWGVHPMNGVSTSPMFYSTKKQNGFTYSKTDKVEERKYITIGNDVFIGANVTILDGVTIGDGCIIGAGAVVSKDIPPYAIAVGCPIKVIKYRFDEKTIQELLRVKWWDRDSDIHLEVEKNFFDVTTFLKEINK